MKLNTITTIELVNDCNLACKYCINSNLKKHSSREVGVMSIEVFSASLNLLQKLCDRGTQKEINLNGNGESFLDPDLVWRVSQVREVVGPTRFVGMSTNAVDNFTYDMVVKLKQAGLTQLDISPHSPYHARRAIDIIRKVGIPTLVNGAVIVDSHNWAGQLEEEHSIDVKINIICHPLSEGRGYIQKEGNITPCCYDYRNLGVFGSVFDSDILDREVKQYKLCDTCHQRIIDESTDDKHN